MKTFIQITKIKTVLLYIMQSFPKGVECAKLFRILYFEGYILEAIFKDFYQSLGIKFVFYTKFYNTV